MIFKGHFNFLLAPLDFRKLTIYTKSDEEKYIRKEYFYKDHKVSKIIDHINGIVSEYEYFDNNKFTVRFYRFENSPSEKKMIQLKNLPIVTIKK